MRIPWESLDIYWHSTSHLFILAYLDVYSNTGIVTEVLRISLSSVEEVSIEANYVT